MIEIELPDGTVLEAPDNADPSAVAKNYLARAKPSPVDATEGMSTGEKYLAGIGQGFHSLGQGARQVAVDSPFADKILEFGYEKPAKFLGLNPTKTLADERKELQSEIELSRKEDAPLLNTWPGFLGNVTGNIAASAPLLAVPGANTAVGSAAIGGLLSGLQPTVEGESRAVNTALGAGSGLGGFGLGKLANKAVSSAAGRIGLIESKVAAKAAADAASETASARSAAGNAAQNAYRQLEHLRELKAMGLLTPEQKLVAEALGKELSEKAAEKLLPAAAQKELTAKSFKELTENETERAVRLAIERLSNKEVKSQMMARLKRYGPAAVGGMIGNMIFPGLGGMVGGAAAGLTLRPAVRSMFNLAKNPAVQHRLLSPVANAGLLGDPLVPPALGLLGSSIYAGQQ